MLRIMLLPNSIHRMKFILHGRYPSKCWPIFPPYLLDNDVSQDLVGPGPQDLVGPGQTYLDLASSAYTRETSLKSSTSGQHRATATTASSY